MEPLGPPEANPPNGLLAAFVNFGVLAQPEVALTAASAGCSGWRAVPGPWTTS